MDTVQFVVAHWSEIVSAVTALVTASAAIAALTPTPKDDEAVAKIRRIIDLLAMNWGHAANNKK